MTMPAPGSVSTKATIIPRTIFDFTLGIDVKEGTFLFVAGVEARIEIAFGHFRHVVFVEEFTAVAFLAKSSKPMLAHNRFLFSLDVAEGTEFFIAST